MEMPLRCLCTEFLVLEVLYLIRGLETPLRCLCIEFLALRVSYLMRGLVPRSMHFCVLQFGANLLHQSTYDNTSNYRCTS